MNNTTFPFYTSTAMQDTNRYNTPVVRICPRYKLPPFQIKRVGSGLRTINLVDCNGNKTDITAWFGSKVFDSAFTGVNYINYAGTPLTQDLPYGVYYLELTDASERVYYSEHFSVRNLQPNYLTGWANDGSFAYNTLVTSGRSILTAVEAATGRANAEIGFDLIPSQPVLFSGNLSVSTGQVPYALIWGNGTALSSPVQLTEGLFEVELTSNYSSVGTSLPYYIQVRSTAASTFSLLNAASRKNHGNFVHIKFSNSNDLRHSNGYDIMYSKGGWCQEVYLDTRLNIPKQQYVEVGNELDGLFVPEQLNSTYLFSIVDYHSRSLLNGLRYLPMHDNVVITDEVGNRYTPDTGNIEVTEDWNTFDTGTIRIEFNDGTMQWVNDQTNIP